MKNVIDFISQYWFVLIMLILFVGLMIAVANF
jgi:hypothetical protein